MVLIPLKVRALIAALTFVAAAPLLDLAPSAFAGDLVITPTFDSSITGNANAAAIEHRLRTSRLYVFSTGQRGAFSAMR